MSSRVQASGPFAFRVSGKVDYITPKWIIDALWPIDLDPCASKTRPWPTAKNHYTEGGLQKPWKGFVYVNPPYGRGNGEPGFLERLAEHGNGVALIFVKTETALWQELIFPKASAILFIGRGKGTPLGSNRVVFCNTDGSSTGGHFSGSALVGFGAVAVKRLSSGKVPGYLTVSHERIG